MNNGYVQVCVTCCKINSQNSKTLPLICPKTNMPCFAIHPEYLVPEVSKEMTTFAQGFNRVVNDVRKVRMPIECKYIDQNFVETRCEAFDELAAKGDKTIYTMDAY